MYDLSSVLGDKVHRGRYMAHYVSLHGYGDVGYVLFFTWILISF